LINAPTTDDVIRAFVIWQPHRHTHTHNIPGPFSSVRAPNKSRYYISNFSKDEHIIKPTLIGTYL